MTRTDYRIIKRDLRKEKQTFLCRTAAIVLLSMLLLAVMVTGFPADASEDITAPRVKYYTSVSVEAGDNLWTLCDHYLSAEYADKATYIEEVQRLNHLSDDFGIEEGSFLVIPYYVTLQ